MLILHTDSFFHLLLNLNIIDLLTFEIVVVPTDKKTKLWAGAYVGRFGTSRNLGYHPTFHHWSTPPHNRHSHTEKHSA